MNKAYMIGILPEDPELLQDLQNQQRLIERTYMTKLPEKSQPVAVTLIRKFMLAMAREQELVGAIRFALEGTRRFELEINGYDVFEKTGRDNGRLMLFAKMEESTELNDLYEALHKALAPVVELINKPKVFTPHIPLARRDFIHFGDTRAEFREKEFHARWTCSQITLFRLSKETGWEVNTVFTLS